MSESHSVNQNEKAAKIRRKPERESVLSPTFAAIRQTSGNDRPQPRPAGSGLLQRQCRCGKHTIAGGVCEACQQKGASASAASLAEIGQAGSTQVQTFPDRPWGPDFSAIPARTLTTSSWQIVQADLTVNAPGDPYEQEADRVAGAVMRMPASPVSPPLNDLNDWLKPTVSRLPAISRLQTSGGGGAFQAPASVEAGIQQMRGSGQSLPEEEQAFFEERMGYDFSQVRVHTDARAVQASRDIQAQAFTIGHNIAFNEGAYQPGTAAGRYLLAHELTHVVQQGAAGLQRKSELRASPSSQVRRHLQLLRQQPDFDASLYRKEIAQFQQANPAAEIAAKQQQLLEPVAIRERDNSQTLRRCGGGGSSKPAPKEPQLLTDFAAKFPDAAELIRKSEASMKLVNEAATAGAEFGGYSEEGPGKKAWPYTAGNKVYVPKARTDKVVAMSDFLFEINNAIRKPKFAGITKDAIAGKITAEQYAYKVVEQEVEGMLRLGEVWAETKKSMGGGSGLDKYDSDFFLSEYKQFKEGKKTKDDIIQDVLARVRHHEPHPEWTVKQFYMDQYKQLTGK